jgi:RNA polymerase sigma-70 factor (ECF subfamily)
MARASGHVDANGAPPDADSGVQLAVLLHDARAGSADASQRLFEAIAPVMRRVCRGVLGDRHLDLEDTIQECLVDVLRALPHYRSEGELVHYVTKIAIRRAILVRRRGAQRERSLRVLEALQDADVRPAAAASAAEHSRMLSDVLARISEVQGETLVLRVILGFSMEEIASTMSVPVNTVRTRLRLAKDALRRVVELRQGP